MGVLDDMKHEAGISEQGCVAGCVHRMLVGLVQLAALSVVFSLITLSIWAAVRFRLIDGFTGVALGLLFFVAIFALDLTMKDRILNVVAIGAFEVASLVLLLLKKFEVLDSVAAYIGMAVVLLVLLRMRGYLSSEGLGSSRNANPSSSHAGVSMEERKRQVEQDRAWTAFEEGERARQERLADSHRAEADWVRRSWSDED